MWINQSCFIRSSVDGYLGFFLHFLYTVVTIVMEISSVLALPGGGERNSGERHRAVLRSKSFIRQSEHTLLRKDESRLSRSQKQLHNRVGWGFLE